MIQSRLQIKNIEIGLTSDINPELQSTGPIGTVLRLTFSSGSGKVLQTSQTMYSWSDDTLQAMKSLLTLIACDIEEGFTEREKKDAKEVLEDASDSLVTWGK